jgi:hypothetical protein
MDKPVGKFDTSHPNYGMALKVNRSLGEERYLYIKIVVIGVGEICG